MKDCPGKTQGTSSRLEWGHSDWNNWKHSLAQFRWRVVKTSSYSTSIVIFDIVFYKIPKNDDISGKLNNIQGKGETLQRPDGLCDFT